MVKVRDGVKRIVPSPRGRVREGDLCYNTNMNKNNIIARKLRKNQTPQEQKFWNLVRAHRFYNLEFRRQYPLGDYIVDFICREKKLIVEIDGGQHNSPENVIKDLERTQYLNSKGYKVIRFWNNDIDNNIEGIFDELRRIIFE